MELKEVLAYKAGYRDGKRDATPPTSAEWITWYHGQPDGKATFSYSCSSCGWPTIIETPFCPGCGARIRKKEETKHDDQV